ncbi:MAG: hypothetical protein JO027_19030 [Solirubrobacterales bacterium]|nr:hypothetical protein [Solirubrobacterales bacterium]
MHRPETRSIKVGWTLAVLTPLLAAVAAWVWTAITTSARDCATGTRGNYVGLVGLAVLALLAPIGIGWQSRRMSGSVARAVSPIAFPDHRRTAGPARFAGVVG